MQRTKFVLTATLVTAVAMMLNTGRSLAYQSLLSKAKKFGAKDCLFCHTHEDGGQDWNDRGQWLIDQKEKRKAEKIDVEWLVDYKPDEKTDEQKDRQPEKKEKPSLACGFRIAN